MDRSTSSTSQLIQRVIHLAWSVLVAQLAMMAHAVIDTAMAGRLSAIVLASVGIAAAIMSTAVVMRRPFSPRPDDPKNSS